MQAGPGQVPRVVRPSRKRRGPGEFPAAVARKEGHVVPNEHISPPSSRFSGLVCSFVYVWMIRTSSMLCTRTLTR